MNKHKLTLDRPVTYQITVPGALEVKWLDWNNGITITVESDEGGDPITILTITVDQAALQGLLRHLYSLGLPLISAIWIDLSEKENNPSDTTFGV
ncbi:MAG: hypothetical protein PVJ21_14070 [Anaerolineales bacterium]